MMPRLSEDLTGPKHPERCQSCGNQGELDLLHATAGVRRWIEHDERDRPEDIVIVLCGQCSDRLIEPHARLYSPVPINAPLPGCMELCSDCRHREGVRCTHLDLKKNGGAGIAIAISKPQVIFLDGTGKNGRRMGWQHITYERPPSKCAGREESANTSGANT